MDPLIDEKLVLTVSSSFMELAYDWLGISIQREAYGPTLNEGLCFEYCSRCAFSGDIHADLYFGLDGFTRLQILPYIARKFSVEEHHPEVAESALISFMNQLSGMVCSELKEFMENIHLQPPENFSHKLVPLPGSSYRKYMLIFFLKDDQKPAYLGRAYLFIAIRK